MKLQISFLSTRQIEAKYYIGIILLMAYIILITFQEIFNLPVVTDKIQLPELVFLPLFLASIFTFWKYKKERKNFVLNQLDKTILVFVVLFGIMPLYHNTISVLLEWIGLLYLSTLYFIMRFWGSLLPTYFYEILDRSTLILAILASIGGFIGIISAYLGYNLGMGWMPDHAYPYFGHVARSSGFTRHPNMLASILAFCWLVRFGKAKSMYDFMTDKWQYFIIIGLLSTLSKSMLILLILFIYGALKREWIKQPYIKIGLFVCNIIFIGILVFFSHFLILKDFSENTIDILLKGDGSFGTDKPIFYLGEKPVVPTVYGLQKYTALIAFHENPLWGVGSFPPYVSTLVDKKIVPYYLANIKPHGTYNGILGQWGIFIFAVFCYLFWQIRKQILALDSEEKLFFSLIFIFFALESLMSDELNFRHLWLALAWLGHTIFIKNNYPSVYLQKNDR